MKVFYHHIYEYNKGIRDLILHTLPKRYEKLVRLKLESQNIDYIIREISKDMINVFFGNKSCVELINTFGNKPLDEFSLEEDFILGVMLGYNRLQQVERFLNRKQSINEIA